jgi:hypothetical protein
MAAAIGRPHALRVTSRLELPRVAGGPPPEAGLYACLFSGLVFWFFCSSKHTVITVTSALSLLIGASVGDLSGGDPARQASLAAGVALFVAVIAIVAWLVKAGSAVGFFSETVLVGFKSGLALYRRARSSRGYSASKGRTEFLGRSAISSAPGRHASDVSPGGVMPCGPHRRQALAEASAVAFLVALEACSRRGTASKRTATRSWGVPQGFRRSGCPS